MIAKIRPPHCAREENFTFIGSQELLDQVITALNYCFGHIDGDATECFYTVEEQTKENQCQK